MKKSPTGMMRRNLSDGRGFTLIELTVVAFILVLFTAMAVSQFRQSFDATGRDIAMQNLLTAMSFARERAILEQRDYGVQLMPAENAYRLLRGGEKIPGHWGKAQAFPASVQFIGPETSILFHPDGTATQALLPFRSRGNPIQIAVDPVSGKGSLHEPL